MPKQAVDSIHVKLIYDGTGPVTWSRDPGAFGLQDKAGVLHVGAPSSDATVVFNLTLDLKSDALDALVLSGPFAHGPPTGRFLYLGWRNKQGGFAQRLKLPLSTITRSDAREALVGKCHWWERWLTTIPK